MKKNIIIYIFLILFISSCTLIDKKLCRNFYTTDECFRASSVATSNDRQLSSEKALLIAKKEIALEVDTYILSKFSHQTFLADPEFENKLTVARKTILNDITIICSLTTHNRRKNIYKTRMSIEMSKSSIDETVSKNLKATDIN